MARTNAHGKGRLEGPGALSWLRVDGAVAGAWSRKRTGKKVELRVEPVSHLARKQHVALEAEAERVGALWGLEVVLSLGLPAR